MATESAGYLLPRNSLLLLLLAQAMVILPLFGDISWWILPAGMLCGGWRWLQFRGLVGYPRRWLKMLLIVAAALGVGLTSSGAFNLETATGLLVVAFLLKLLEMRSRRDAMVVIYLCYFVLGTRFLFDQTLFPSLYQLLAFVVVTGALVGLHQRQDQPWAALATAGKLVVQALPLALVLFLMFPRLAPLWSVPMPGASATGISDEIRPGDIAQLSRSDAIAFRVDFTGEIPPSSERYWRGLVYSQYEAGTWRQLPMPPISQADVRSFYRPAEATTELLRYQVLLEPSQRKWLFALEMPLPLSGNLVLTRDYRVEATEPVQSLRRYELAQLQPTQLDGYLPDWLRERETRLPTGSNPRSRAFALALRAQVASDAEMVEALLQHIRSEPYFYTLSPPRLGADDIDAFWFDTRTGFCAHYAGALVYILRAANIPARMVGGYQGGEVNPRTGHLVVRQYDAHAWVEAWLPDLGWQRIDPTAAIAPSRIEHGLNAVLTAQERADLPMLYSLRMGNTGVLISVLSWFESIEHRWNLLVVGYDARTQARYLQRLLGEVNSWRMTLAFLLGAGGSLLLALVSLRLLRSAVVSDPLQARLQRTSRRLTRAGLQRQPGEPPAAYLARLAQAADRPYAEEIATVQTALYDPATTAPNLRQIKRWLRRLELRLILQIR